MLCFDVFSHSQCIVDISKGKQNKKNSVIQKRLKARRKRVKVKSLRRVRLFATPWTAACQAPLSMGFSRLEYWSALPFPSPGDLPNLGIEPESPAL